MHDDASRLAWVSLLFALAVSATPVVLPLGAALPLTGQIAIPGRGFQRAFDIAVVHLNEDLEVDGRYVFEKMRVCDTETSVLKGADCALGFADFCGSAGYRPIGISGAGFSSVTMQMFR